MTVLLQSTGGARNIPTISKQKIKRIKNKRRRNQIMGGDDRG
jgi:hypothetical protein